MYVFVCMYIAGVCVFVICTDYGVDIAKCLFFLFLYICLCLYSPCGVWMCSQHVVGFARSTYSTARTNKRRGKYVYSALGIVTLSERRRRRRRGGDDADEDQPRGARMTAPSRRDMAKRSKAKPRKLGRRTGMETR